MAPSRDWACFVQRSINFKQLHPARRLLGNQYHIAGSPLLRFEWFRRQQQLHFVHHTHGNSNFAIIDNFWDRLLGTYRDFDADDAENPHRMAGSDGQAKWSSAHSSALSDP